MYNQEVTINVMKNNGFIPINIKMREFFASFNYRKSFKIDG
jgi:hypothetical protein